MTGHPDDSRTGDTTRSSPAPGARPRRLRLWILRFVLLAGSLGLVLALGEVGARLAGHRPLQLQPDWLEKLRTIQRPVPDGGPLMYELVPGGRVTFAYRGPPVEYRINADGLRADRRYERPKPPGVRRILMLGDSVLFGLGVPVEETLSGRLEQLLPGVEAVNSGVGGYSTYSERIWLESQGLSYEPDLVIVVYCPNDVDEPLDQFAIQVSEPLPPFPPESIPNKDYHSKRRAAEEARRNAPPRSASLPKSLARWSQSHSALVNLCLQPVSFGRRSRSHERCLIAAADRDAPEHAWLREQLDGIASLAKGAGVPILFVYIPVRYELDPHDPRHSELGRTVCALAEKSGMKAIDVTDLLGPMPLSHLDVTHLSIEGSRAVADRLAAAVLQRDPSFVE